MCVPALLAQLPIHHATVPHTTVSQDGCEALCGFVKSVALVWAAHVKRGKEIDDAVVDDINGALDDFDEASSTAEKAMTRLLQDLRKSPDLDSLAARMEAVVTGLNDIEQLYRSHHSACMCLPGVWGGGGVVVKRSSGWEGRGCGGRK